MACAASVGAGCLCIARGCRILTSQGLRAIETLVVGDAVYCIDPRTHELLPTRIAARRSGVRECMALHAAGRRLVLTSTHPVYDAALGEFRQAGVLALDPHARVLVADQASVRVVPIDRVETYVGLMEVHDVSIEHPLHDFVAEGIVVHNKSEEDPGDSWNSFPGAPPSAEVDARSPVLVGTFVRIDGSGSSDPDGDPLDFRFTVETVPAMSEATLSNGETVRVTSVSSTHFTPDVKGAYTIRLDVSDAGEFDDERSASDSVTVVAQSSPERTTTDEATSTGSDASESGTASGSSGS